MYRHFPFVVGSEVSNMTEPVRISMKMAAKGGNPKPVFWTVSDEGMLAIVQTTFCMQEKSLKLWNFSCYNENYGALVAYCNNCLLFCFV